MAHKPRRSTSRVGWFDERLGDAFEWSRHTKNTFIDFEEKRTSEEEIDDNHAIGRREQSAPAVAMKMWGSPQFAAIEEASMTNLQYWAAAAALQWAEERDGTEQSRGRSAQRTGPRDSRSISSGRAVDTSIGNHGRASTWRCGSGQRRRVGRCGARRSKRVAVPSRSCSSASRSSAFRGTPARLEAQSLSRTPSQASSIGTPARLEAQSLSRPSSSDARQVATRENSHFEDQVSELQHLSAANPKGTPSQLPVESLEHPQWEALPERCVEGETYDECPLDRPVVSLDVAATFKAKIASAAGLPVYTSNRFCALSDSEKELSVDEAPEEEEQEEQEHQEPQEPVLVSTASTREVAQRGSRKATKRSANRRGKAGRPETCRAKPQSRVLADILREDATRDAVKCRSAAVDSATACLVPATVVPDPSEQRPADPPARDSLREMRWDILQRLHDDKMWNAQPNSGGEVAATSSSSSPEQIIVASGFFNAKPSSPNPSRVADAPSAPSAPSTSAAPSALPAPSEPAGSRESVTGKSSKTPSVSSGLQAPASAKVDNKLTDSSALTLAMFTAKLNEHAILMRLRETAARRCLVALPIDPSAKECPDVLLVQLGAVVLCEAVDTQGWAFGTALAPKSLAGRRGCFRCEGMCPVVAELQRHPAGERLEMITGKWEESSGSRNAGTQERLRQKALFNRMRAARKAWETS